MSSFGTPNRPGRSRYPGRSRRRLAALFAAATLAAAPACGADAPPDGGRRDPSPSAASVSPSAGRIDPAPSPGTAWVVFGADTVVAEVASTPEARERGLMFRDEVPDGTGMLFVFDREETRSFWMQDTFVDLDIAFMDAGFRVVDVQTMEARSTDFHESAAPALYALEVRAGWFAERGIDVGEVAAVRFGG